MLSPPESEILVFLSAFYCWLPMVHVLVLYFWKLSKSDTDLCKAKKSTWEYQKSHGKSVRGWKVKCNSACFQLASHCVGCCEKRSKDGVWDKTEHCMCSTHKPCHAYWMLQTGTQIGNSWPYGATNIWYLTCKNEQTKNTSVKSLSYAVIGSTLWCWFLN